MKKEEIFEVLKNVAEDALDVDPEEVEMSSKLIGDLDAESLDIIDLLFKAGKKIGVKLSMKEVQESIRGGLSEDDFFDDEGFVSVDGMKVLNNQFPNISQDLPEKIRTKDLLKLLDMGYLVELFYTKVSE
ncbi:acyl carrier protein [Streptococcus salivarius]|jgi:hypothetical protein|uniref:acyl carrier protein n=1 Tax=Streptococcus salivarius TaxID=1304 RepID=UPI001604F5FB|nr:hypothetical protein [Streptococcus salivarius]